VHEAGAREITDGNYKCVKKQRDVDQRYKDTEDCEVEEEGGRKREI